MAYGDLAAPLKKKFAAADTTVAASLTNPESVAVEVLEIAVGTSNAGTYTIFIMDDNSGAAGDVIGALIIDINGYRDSYRPSGLRMLTSGKLWFKMAATIGASIDVTVTLRYQFLV